MRLLNRYPFSPAILFFAFISSLFCLPGNQFPTGQFFNIPQLDKAVHISFFATLCLLFSFPFKKSLISVPKIKQWFLIICLLGISYGIAIEFIQENWIPNRSFELLDIVADSIGCLLALGISYRKLLPTK
ncbi:MAG: VanZ family protein [Bacteroidetes bacterium]|nr:VanZ family protein [Bacteroidota bacterium]